MFADVTLGPDALIAFGTVAAGLFATITAAWRSIVGDLRMRVSELEAENVRLIMILIERGIPAGRPAPQKPQPPARRFGPPAGE